MSTCSLFPKKLVVVCPLHQNSRLSINSLKRVGSSLNWTSSFGKRAPARIRLHIFAIQVVPLVCLYTCLNHVLQSTLTLGKQKGVMISHRNVISNVLQIAAFEKPYRDSVRQPGTKYVTEVVLGLLPQSHIYSLVVICHATTYRGDQVINLPKFDLQHLLSSIQTFKINGLFLVSRSTLSSPLLPDLATYGWNR